MSIKHQSKRKSSVMLFLTEYYCFAHDLGGTCRFGVPGNVKCMESTSLKKTTLHKLHVHTKQSKYDLT